MKDLPSSKMERRLWSDGYEVEEWKTTVGVYHREGGPAVSYFGPEFQGRRSWFINGKRHREDGPAIEFVNLDPSLPNYMQPRNRYFLNDKELSEEDFLATTSGVTVNLEL